MSAVNNKNEFYSNCFKPLALWMRILGIELDPFDSSKRRNFCSRSFSLLMFSITVSTNVCFAVLTFKQEVLLQLPDSARHFRTMVIDFGSFMILVIGTHAALLAVPGNPEWKFLWSNLQQLANENGQLFNDKSRKTVLTSLLFIIADGFINIIQSVLVVLKNDGRPLMTKSFDLISFLTKIYGVSGLVLFATIGWMTSEGFVQLHQQVIALDPGIRSNPRASSSDLKKLRHLFLTLSETVLHIGHCFGPLLLVWIVYIFISVIANSFYLVDSFRGNIDQPSEVSFWICTVTSNLIFLFILASTPVNLQHESLNIWKSLRRMRFDDPSLQSQLDSMTMEVLQSPTEMTAMDLFSVDLTLFPTLVGTTLTYLIILSQFQ